MSSSIRGLDPGTCFVQSAFEDNGKIDLRMVRNAFVELEDTDDIEDVLQQNKWHYLKSDGHYYVVGEDAFKIVRMFPSLQLRRPMQNGVFNPGEEKKVLVMSEIVKGLLGNNTDPKGVVCTCVSSPSVDGSVDSNFHKAKLISMFKRLKWENVKIIDEALAVILSENPKAIEKDGNESSYSGLGISFGGGRINAVLAYKGIQVLGLSTQNSGDWVDAKVAEQTGAPLSTIIAKKERELNFLKPEMYDENDILYALDVYYDVMIENVFKHFAAKFVEVKSEFDSDLDVVLAGGTSVIPGFDKKVERVIRKLKLPFRIKNVRMASDPRNAVVKGLLIQAAITHKKIVKASEDELKELLG